MPKKLLVLDFMNIAFRAYYGLGAREKLANSKGKLTYACYGVALAINTLIEQFKPDYLVFAADSKGRTFRHELYEGYKSNRSAAPDEFLAQLPDLKRMIEAYGFKTIRFDATEADDVIGTVATKYASPDLHVYIVSGDKDFMQLVGDNVSIIRPYKHGGYEVASYDAVFEKFGCRPFRVVDALALIGDAVDMVPGVTGIGEKRAAALIKSYGSLDGIYESLHKLTPKIQKSLVEGKSNAYLSKSLVVIKTDLPVEYTLEDFAVSEYPLQRPDLKAFFAEMEFQSFLMEGSGLVGEMPTLVAR